MADAKSAGQLMITHQGDGNSLEGEAFNLKIKDGLSDLINGALGIRRSKIPDIRKKVLNTKEAERAKRQEANTKTTGRDAPAKQTTLAFPLNYFAGQTQPGGSAGVYETWFPNSIHFRSLKRKNPFASAEAKTLSDTNAGKEGAFQKYVDATTSSQKWQASEYDTYDIFLHLPEKLQDEVKVEYAEAKGGAMQQFMARLFAFGSDDDAVSGMQGNRKFDMDEIMTSFKGMMPGGEIVQKAAGYMTNPMLFQSMKNVGFRTYNYSFQLKPTSPAEARMIRAIVHAFKLSMLPGTAGENAGIWTLPNEWAISFEGPIADWVDFPMTAVCVSATVDYSQYLMGGDIDGKGIGAPSSITLNLSFTETMQLSRQRFHEEVSPHNAGRVSRAEEGTQIGRNSYAENDLEQAANAEREELETGGGEWYNSKWGKKAKWLMPVPYWIARMATAGVEIGGEGATTTASGTMGAFGG